MDFNAGNTYNQGCPLCTLSGWEVNLYIPPTYSPAAILANLTLLPPASTYELDFSSNGTFGFALFDVSSFSGTYQVSAVPIPGSVLLLVTAVAILGFFSRRKPLCS